MGQVICYEPTADMDKWVTPGSQSSLPSSRASNPKIYSFSAAAATGDRYFHQPDVAFLPIFSALILSFALFCFAQSDISVSYKPVLSPSLRYYTASNQTLLTPAALKINYSASLYDRYFCCWDSHKIFKVCSHFQWRRIYLFTNFHDSKRHFQWLKRCLTVIIFFWWQILSATASHIRRRHSRFGSIWHAFLWICRCCFLLSQGSCFGQTFTSCDHLS